MTTEIELNGTKYRLVGNEWLEAATYIKPPQVIIQELNRRLPKRPTSEVAVKASKPRRANTGRLGLEFEGLRDEDFKKDITGTNWRRRQSLGGLLAQHLSDKTGYSFNSWSVDRRASVHVVLPDRFDNQDPYPYAKFEFRLDENKAQYGLYIEKSDEPMDSTWDWKRFMSVLDGGGQLLQNIEEAMDKFGVYWSAVTWYPKNSKLPHRTITVSRSNPLLWQEDDYQENVTWPIFVERLRSIPEDHWCDLHLYYRMDKKDALAAGVGLAEPVTAVFHSLLPLYLASTRS